MRATTKLKAKIDQHYRKAQKKSLARCSVCKYVVMAHPVYGLNGDFRFYDSRCEKLGLKNSRRYAVSPNFVCDMFVGREEFGVFDHDRKTEEAATGAAGAEASSGV